jgi:predicted hotdog family 3-hydroxylacyl-ACP dehydratase
MQAMTLDKEQIEQLIPHSGAMCLLHSVLSWDANHIHCTATSHHDADNPLRTVDSLPAYAGVEYAAQAVAVHGGLNNQADRPNIGYLASLRNVTLNTDRLDMEKANLDIYAEKLVSEGSRMLYKFHIVADGIELLVGQLAVVLKRELA